MACFMNLVITMLQIYFYVIQSSDDKQLQVLSGYLPVPMSVGVESAHLPAVAMLGVEGSHLPAVAMVAAIAMVLLSGWSPTAAFPAVAMALEPNFFRDGASDGFV